MSDQPINDDLCRFGQGTSETRIPADADHVRGAVRSLVVVVLIFATLTAAFVACVKALGWNFVGFIAGILAVAMCAGLMWIMAGGEQ